MKGKTTNSNKTVFVSGAAGGLGNVLVKKFARIGYQVIAVDIDTEGLAIFDATDNIITKTLDVTNIEQIGFLIKELDLDRNGIDILVCLAGIYNTYPVTEADPDLFKKILAVNLHGAVSLVQGLLRPLIKNKGRVIVVSSESYKIQAMFQPYMISKAALEAYCRVARQELALKDVTLSVIRPGAIRTPLLKWMQSPGDTGEYPVFQRELRKSWEKSIKMVGKVATPEEVAGIILLASIVSKPKRIYRVNNNLLLILISHIPAGIIDRLIVRIFK